ncbi:MAG: DUF6745 domain-containing protein [bacterium]
MNERLSQNQKDKISEYVDKWIKIALDTKVSNRLKAEELIDKIYKQIGEAPVSKIWCRSPFEAQKLLKEKYNHDAELSNFCFNGSDAGWLAYCDFLKNEMNNNVDDILLQIELALYCGWYYPTDELCILCEKPEEIHYDNERHLHNDGGPAIKYLDGECLYFLNGVKVSKEIAETPWHELDPKLILKESNAEVRREIVRKVGIERVVVELDANCIDKEGKYELLLLNIGDDILRPYLKMLNPSIGTWHVEGVHPDCKTVKDALAWRNGTSQSPDILT